MNSQPLMMPINEGLCNIYWQSFMNTGINGIHRHCGTIHGVYNSDDALNYV